MIGQSKKALRDASEWERPWTIYLSKAMIVFFGAMLGFSLMFFVSARNYSHYYWSNHKL